MNKNNNTSSSVKEKNDKPICFAWLSKTKCNALIKKNCEKCRFYKPKDEVANYSKFIKY